MSDQLAHQMFRRPGQVAWLVPRDQLPRDDEQRKRMTNLADKGATPDLRVVREELAFRLSTVSLSAATCDFAEAKVCARRLRRIGLDTGFPTLAHAADNVLDCLETFDGAALGATVARLHRLGVMALSDLTG